MNQSEFINASKILRHPEALVSLRKGQIPPVYNVEMDLSESCQLSCQGCDFPQHSATHMNWATAVEAARMLKFWRTEAVVFTGGGEPTLCPDFSPITHLYSQRHKLGLYTNGIEPVFVDMADHFQWIFVSLDAADKGDWAAYKHASSRLFHQVLDNISMAAQKTTVGVGFLIHAGNYNRIEDMARTALEAEPTYVHFRPLYPSDDDIWMYDAVPILERVSKWDRVSVAWDKFADIWDWHRDYDTCWASMFIRLIDAEGTIWACPTTRWKRRLGTVWDFKNLRAPLEVTEECRACCRGHRMNLVLDYAMQDGPHDAFV